MGVEIVHMRSIRKYLFWGSIVVLAAYLWATLGTMLALDASKSEALALLCGVSALVAIAIYAVSEFVRRRAPSSPPLAPA